MNEFKCYLYKLTSIPRTPSGNLELEVGILARKLLPVQAAYAAMVEPSPILWYFVFLKDN